LKICRCYLKDYREWKYYSLSVDKQRELILNYLKDSFVSAIDDNEIEEIISYEPHIETSGGSERNRFMGHNDWIRKSRIEDSKTKIKIYWYVDFDSRENLSNLIDELNVNENFLSADFTEDYSKFEVEPDTIVKESTKEAIFYQTIFDLIRDKNSLREIANKVSTNEMTISAPAIGELKKKSEN
jgi:hypothetical protein